MEFTNLQKLLGLITCLLKNLFSPSGGSSLTRICSATSSRGGKSRRSLSLMRKWQLDEVHNDDKSRDRIRRTYLCRVVHVTGSGVCLFLNDGSSLIFRDPFFQAYVYYFFLLTSHGAPFFLSLSGVPHLKRRLHWFLIRLLIRRPDPHYAEAVFCPGCGKEERCLDYS